MNSHLRLRQRQYLENLIEENVTKKKLQLIHQIKLNVYDVNKRYGYNKNDIFRTYW